MKLSLTAVVRAAMISGQSPSSFYPAMRGTRALMAGIPRLFLLFGLGTCVAVACSAGGDGQNSTFTGGLGGSGDGGNANPTLTTGNGGSGGGLDPDAACGLFTDKAKSTPLDLYIAFDKSSSMSGTKWENAKLGLSAFVNDDASKGISAALNLFPLDNNPTCDQFAYQPPIVAFGPLPQNGQAIDDAMTLASPNGFLTPIYPALGGAILGARQESDNNDGHTGAVLLVTDGEPQGPATTCSGIDPEDPAEIAALAAAGVNFGIRTFVIGLPGVNQSVANQIAAAGGTGSVILVGNSDIAGEFQEALAKVRGEALPCEYELPEKVENGDIDPYLVNLLLSLDGDDAELLAQDPDCDGEGWRYDDPSDPKKIVLCPESCSKVRVDFSASIDILLGCKTEVVK
jgi:hypothetical protein